MEPKDSDSNTITSEEDDKGVTKYEKEVGGDSYSSDLELPVEENKKSNFREEKRLYPEESKKGELGDNDYNQSKDNYDGAKEEKLNSQVKKIKHQIEERKVKKEELSLRAVPKIKLTSFSVFPTISTKIVTSGYAHIDTYGATDPTNTLANLPYFVNENGHEIELDISENCIIFHPGSKNLRLGFVSDPFPKEVPHVIARKLKKQVKKENKDEDEEEKEKKLNLAIDVGEKEVLTRLQNAKRKPVYNAINQVQNYNSSTQPTPLLEHNDPLREKWFQNEKKEEVIFGNDVLNSHNIEKQYLSRYPIKYGKLNTVDYTTLMEVRSDLEALWEYAIINELGLQKKYFEGYSVGLVIPDTYCSVYLTNAIDIILNTLGFYSIFIIQESVAAAFGAGLSQACVVNIGATRTNVSCVEDGAIIAKSRISLPYGGDDITKLLFELLLKSKFPYPELKINTFEGWEIGEGLKKILSNYNELELAVQIFHFFVPKYNQATLRYDIKSYDEGFIAPMLLFNPIMMDVNLNDKLNSINKSSPWIKSYVQQWLDSVLDRLYQGHNLPNANKKSTLNVISTPNQGSTPLSGANIAEEEENGSDDDINTIDNNVTEGEDSVCHNLTDEVIGLDQAIAKSIKTCTNDETTLRRWYTSIVVTGGGAALISGFDKLLQEKLSHFAPNNCNVEVLSSVRDLDPRNLAWKGASVMAKLDITQELFINFAEWNNKGIHALRDKILFSWPLPW
ncbi:actin-like ATPase domain-containing protein [Neoconidiobolus thromboides FSU 785]|nr:actin-like ATPase domain-containing protein [Neoconidiobolus thromboides FSU 785]